MSQTPFPRLAPLPVTAIPASGRPSWSNGLQGQPSGILPSTASISSNGFPSVNAMAAAANVALKNVASSAYPTTAHRAAAAAAAATAAATSSKRQAEIREMIEKERKIKIGSENMLEALNGGKGARGQRMMVEAELQGSVKRIEGLKHELDKEIQHGEIKMLESTVLSLASEQSLNQTSGPGSNDLLGSSMGISEKESPSVTLSGLMQDIGAEAKEPDHYIETCNRLADLFKAHPSVRFEVSWPIFGKHIQKLVLSSKREMIAAAYRAMRTSITDRRSLQILRGYHLDIPLLISLGQVRAVVEREQALKLVRAFVDVPDGVRELETSIINVVVAIAEEPKDRLRGLAILTLAEMVVRDVKVVRRSRGLTVLANTIGGLSIEIASSSNDMVGGNSALSGAFISSSIAPLDGLARALLHAFDSDRDSESAGLESAVSVFSEGPEADPSELEARVAGAVKVAITALRTWPGLIALAGSGGGGIQTLVAGLNGEDIVVNGVVDVIVELMGLSHDGGEQVPKSTHQSYEDDVSDDCSGNYLAFNRGNVAENEAELYGEDGDDLTDDISERLTSKYRSLLLAILIRAGLVSRLVYAWRRFEGATKQRLLRLIVTVQDRASALGLVIDDLTGGTNQLLPLRDPYLDQNYNAKNSSMYDVDLVYAIASIKPQTGNSFGKRTLQDTPDEAGFRQMVLDTGVLATRNPAKWKWDAIEQVIRGPLKNSARLDEALKTSRFIERLLSFYRPFKGRFADLPNTPSNQRYVQIGCGLIKALLRHPAGVRMLVDSKMIRQLAEAIAHFDPSSGLVSSSPVFSVSRIEESMVGGYFAIVGALSSMPAGVAILSRWRVWNMLLHIVERPDRPDLAQGFLGALDYKVDSLARVVLSRALTGSQTSVPTRVHATNMLRPHAVRPNPARRWALGLLLTQLYDPDLPICERAVSILAEACVHPAALATVVARRPALDHLGELAAPLLLRFLATSAGYSYLQQLDYIARQMDDWYLGRNEEYVGLVETILHLKLAGSKSSTDIPWPPHFYRELVRTPDGCVLLQSKMHFQSFHQTVLSSSKALPLPDAPQKYPPALLIPSVLLKLKAALWAIGSIGATPLGAPFLDESGTVPHIIELAHRHPILSIRGTAFYTLILVGRSELGAEMLRMQHWKGLGLDESGKAGVVNSASYITSATRFKNTPSNEFPPLPSRSARPFGSGIAEEPETEEGNEETVVQPSKRRPSDALLPPQLDVTSFARPRRQFAPAHAAAAELILEKVSDLGSALTRKKKANEIQAMRREHPLLFESPEMWCRVAELMNRYHFRLSAVRFLMEGFTGWRGVVQDRPEDPVVEGGRPRDEERMPGSASQSRRPTGESHTSRAS